MKGWMGEKGIASDGVQLLFIEGWASWGGRGWAAAAVTKWDMSATAEEPRELEEERFGGRNCMPWAREWFKRFPAGEEVKPLCKANTGEDSPLDPVAATAVGVHWILLKSVL